MRKIADFVEKKETLKFMRVYLFFFVAVPKTEYALNINHFFCSLNANNNLWIEVKNVCIYNSVMFN